MATSTTIGTYHVAAMDYADFEQDLGRRTFMDTTGDLQPHIRHMLHFMATARRVRRRNIPLYTSHMPESVSASGEYG
jgi:hypothetical protein